MSWAQLGADACEGQAGANRPLFLGPLGREYLPSIPDVDAALRAGGRVADVGCGLGWSSIGWPRPFTAPGDDVERLMYGYSLMCCLADGMAHQPSAGTGTVMRPSTLRRYAVEAGFADVEILDIANDFFRLYRLR